MEQISTFGKLVNPSLQGCQKQFLSITSLLIHHSVMPEMLPCPLLMNRYSNPAFKGSDDSEGGSIGKIITYRV